jgi:hypothetical protein
VDSGSQEQSRRLVVPVLPVRHEIQGWPVLPDTPDRSGAGDDQNDWKETQGAEELSTMTTDSNTNAAREKKLDGKNCLDTALAFSMAENSMVSDARIYVQKLEEELASLKSPASAPEQASVGAEAIEKLPRYTVGYWSLKDDPQGNLLRRDQVLAALSPRPSEVQEQNVPDHTGKHENAGQTCDMLNGPCSCGAWHDEKDRPQQQAEQGDGGSSGAELTTGWKVEDHGADGMIVRDPSGMERSRIGSFTMAMVHLAMVLEEHDKLRAALTQPPRQSEGGRWISVKERMPEPGTKVWTMAHGMIRGMYAVDERFSSEVEQGRHTHWYQVPPPPTGADGEGEGRG